MAKKILLAAVAVFVAWEALDFVIHGMILAPTYASQPQLWRPQAEMKMGVMFTAVFIAALAFTALYAHFVRPKALGTAVRFGLVWGIGVGVSMGYGTYAAMPIPYTMALTWFLGTVVQACVAGALVGLIVKE
jgi:hypothetical protein